MNPRTKITLTPEQETLLIPLFAKAQPDNPLFYDSKAQEILNQIDYDFSRLRVPYKTVILVCQRAKKLDAVTRDFLGEHPGGVVLHLGCGLDSRFWRVDNGEVEWYDMDMPPVIDLRQQFYPAHARYHVIASSVTDLEWMGKVNAANRPVLVVAEGLLMYLGETDVKRLFLRLREAFPGCPSQGRCDPDRWRCKAGWPINDLWQVVFEPGIRIGKPIPIFRGVHYPRRDPSCEYSVGCKLAHWGMGVGLVTHPHSPARSGHCPAHGFGVLPGAALWLVET